MCVGLGDGVEMIVMARQVTFCTQWPHSMRLSTPAALLLC